MKPYYESGGITIYHCLDEWAKDPALKPKTKAQRETLAWNHVLPYDIAFMPLGSITLSDISRHLALPLGDSGVRQVYNLLAQAFDLAVEAGLSHNPVRAARKPKGIREEILGRDRRNEYLSLDEIDRIHAYCESPPYQRYHGAGASTLNAIALMVETGIRVGEACGLKWRDVEWSNAGYVDASSRDEGKPAGYVPSAGSTAASLRIERQVHRVSGKGLIVESLKTQAGSRGLPLTERASAVLDRQRRLMALWKLRAGEAWNEDAYLFSTKLGNHLDPRHISRAWEAMLRELSIPHLRLHAGTRHTNLTWRAHSGTSPKALQAIAGHAKVSTTMDLYIKGTQEAMVDSNERLEALSALRKEG